MARARLAMRELQKRLSAPRLPDPPPGFMDSGAQIPICRLLAGGGGIVSRTRELQKHFERAKIAGPAP
ncbi:hypothetical protein NDU88_000457 [Pleurodeles waltl]|uniref:Uncharacterized protein n=1 Tax=Pleurodeles waltl TaxID=8319 RepID=A0AAV7URX5_PLEWA|nr:hypothetical protein NDU88_000457 [Pleurodeles waltl]